MLYNRPLLVIHFKYSTEVRYILNIYIYIYIFYIYIRLALIYILGSDGRESACNAGDLGLISG